MDAKYFARWDEYRTFGVELEVKTPRHSSVGTLAADLSRLTGLDVYGAGYTHAVMNRWKVVTDASVSGGFEIVSPPLSGNGGLAELKKVMNALVTLGAKVDRQCGFHVHHSARDLDYDQLAGLVTFYTQFEPVIDLFHPVSRRGSANNFCQGRVADLELDRATRVKAAPSVNKEQVFSNAYHTWDRESRYTKVNLRAWETYGTVEFRQHAGTLNYRKAEMWIKLTQQIVRKAAGRGGIRLGKRSSVTLGEFGRAMRFTGVDPWNRSQPDYVDDPNMRDVWNYFVRRARSLGYED